MALRSLHRSLRQVACYYRPSSPTLPTTQLRPRKRSLLPFSAPECSKFFEGPRISCRFYSSSSSSKPHPPDGSKPIGNIFDLTPEQYAELKEQRIPRDFQYQTYSSPPPETEDDVIFEPKFVDIHAVTELMARKRYAAAIKKAIEVLEPHRTTIQAGYPSHDPTLNAALRHELSECLSLLSLCYMHQEEYDRAIDASLGSADLQPTSEKFSDLASHLLQANRLEEALIASERSIEMDPYGEVDALVTKAYALWKMQKFEGHDLLGLCDLALARDPYVTGAMEVKALYLAHLGKMNEALKTIDRAIAKDDDNFHLIRIKTGFLERTNQLPLALTAVLKFFKEDPESIEAHREAARIALLLKDWKISIEHLKFLISHTEKSEEGRADLVYALIQDGQVEEASKALDEATQNDHRSSIASDHPYNLTSLKRSLAVKKKKMKEL